MKKTIQNIYRAAEKKLIKALKGNFNNCESFKNQEKKIIKIKCIKHEVNFMTVNSAALFYRIALFGYN